MAELPADACMIETQYVHAQHLGVLRVLAWRQNFCVLFTFLFYPQNSFITLSDIVHAPYHLSVSYFFDLSLFFVKPSEVLIRKHLVVLVPMVEGKACIQTNKSSDPEGCSCAETSWTFDSIWRITSNTKIPKHCSRSALRLATVVDPTAHPTTIPTV